MQFNISKETHQKLKDKIKELENEIQKKKLTGTTGEVLVMIGALHAYSQVLDCSLIIDDTDIDKTLSELTSAVNKLDTTINRVENKFR